MTVRWNFDAGGANDYTFARNPDRYGGDTFWAYEPRLTEFDIIGANLPTLQIDGFRGARRTLRFTAITGNMMRVLQNFFLRKAIINNCRDHLYTGASPFISFNCFVVGFVSTLHPSSGTFPGSGEDTYDVEMTIIKMS